MRPLADFPAAARQSLIGQESGRFGLENYVAFFESRYFRRALTNSLTVAALGTAISLLLAVPPPPAARRR